MSRLVCLLAVLVLGLAVLDDARADARAAVLDDARAAFAEGRYAEVLTLLDRAPAPLPARARDEAALLRARAFLATGRHPEAERLLRSLARGAPQTPQSAQHIDARVLLARLYQDTGRGPQALALWKTLSAAPGSASRERRSAPQLTAAAIAARALGRDQDASDLLGEALARDPRHLPAWLERADLYLARDRLDEAADDVRAALALPPAEAPDHVPINVDILVLEGRVLAARGDDEAAEAALGRALTTNPHHAGALALRATRALEAEAFAEAAAEARRILDTNPRSEVAHTVLGALALLGGDQDGFARARAAVEAINPPASRFHRDVATLLGAQRRDEEARALAGEAVRRARGDPRALALLGRLHLQCGDLGEARAPLARAYARDRYDRASFELLQLLEETLPARYQLIDLVPFRLLLPRDEAPGLRPLLEPFLRAAWEDYARRYRVTPAPPLQIELYAEERHYALRTIDAPALETLGTSFRRVITARSPRGARFHWGMMLWHELGHVFALARSAGRVPRWFAEGLAEWETAAHHPDWRRHRQAELAFALQAGALPPLDRLSAALVRARTVDDAVVAYHQSAEAVGFLVRRFGFDAVLTALDRFAAGADTRAALAAATGLEFADFERAFLEDLRARLAGYLVQFQIPPALLADRDALAARAAAHPGDARAQALLGLAWLEAGRATEAAPAIARALALDPRARAAQLASARLALAREEPAGAEDVLRRLLGLGGDGYDARLALAEAALDRGRLDDALGHLAQAARFDPERADPERWRARLLERMGHLSEARQALDRAARLTIHDAAPLRQLLALEERRHQWSRVRALGERIAWIAPYDLEVQLAVARAARAEGDAAAAVATLERALACHPERAGEIQPLLDAVRGAP